MKTSRIPRIAAALLAAALAACGGGGDGGGNAPLAISSTTVNDGVVGSDYNDSIEATGGRGAKTFGLSAGSLPDGLSLSSSGAITGTPAGPTGSFDFTVEVTDSANQPATDTQSFTIDIVDPLEITTAALPDTTAGAAYDATVDVTGGTPPYEFTVVAPGALPAGLSIDATGAVSGTVAADARSEVFTLSVTDSSSPALTDTADYAVDVDLEITTAALPDATGGEDYALTLESQGGLLPLAWSITAGVLPAGIGGPDPMTGEIAGSPDPVCTAAAAAFTVQVTDADTPAQTDTQAFNLTVNPATLEIATDALPLARLETEYTGTVQVTGGVPPYSFALASGTLPGGLDLDTTTGQITGTPDTLETQVFEITVTDDCPGQSATKELSITVTDAPLGRNDTIAQATALPGDGTYRASISPSGDPGTVLAPDEDYYEITTTAASTITLDIDAQSIGSPLDPVIEVVDANGDVLVTCVSPAFNSECINDDEELGVDLDSFLELQVPGATTFYIHVVDWGGNARPDKIYDLVISGVN